jgi:hypothetical protein
VRFRQRFSKRRLELPNANDLKESFPNEFLSPPDFSEPILNSSALNLRSSSHSSAVSWSFSAAMFSSRCASDDVPGIGNMTGDVSSFPAVLGKRLRELVDA